MKHKLLILFSIVMINAVACHHKDQQEQPLHQSSAGNSREKGMSINAFQIDDTTQIKQWIDKGNQVNEKFPDSAIVLYKRALGLSYKLASNKGIAVSLLNIGSCLFHDKNEYKQAGVFAHLALPYCLLVYKENRDLLPRAYNLAANVCFQKGDYDSSIYYYQQAITFLKKKQPPDTLLLVQIYGNIGSVLGTMNELDRALYYFKEARHLLSANNKKHIYFLATANMNIGNYYNKKKENKDSALQYYHAALKLYHSEEGARVKIDIQNAYLFISEIWLLKNNLKEANKYLEAAVLADPKGLDKNESLLLHIGNVHYKNGAFKKAIGYYQKSLEVCEEQGITEGKLDNYYALASSYDTIGLGHLAYRYQVAYSRLKDSVQNEDKVKKVNELEIQYQTSEKDRQLAIKDLNIVKSKAQNQRKTATIWIISLCLLLLLSTLVFLRYRQIFRIRRLLQQKELDILKATIEGEEGERLRVGQELHDGVSGLLSAIKMNLVTLRIKRKDIAKEHNFITTLELADEAADELRKTAHNLVPSNLTDNGITQAVMGFCERINASSYLPIEVQESGLPERLDPAMELVVYRIIQELVHNIMKHSDATQGTVWLSWQKQLLLVTVEDNGVGMPEAEHKNGIGMDNIQKRVKALNGTMEINNVPGEGTSIYIEFPLAN